MPLQGRFGWNAARLEEMKSQGARSLMRQDNQFGLTFLMTNGLVSRYTRYNTQENFQQISSNTLDCYILISHEISKKDKSNHCLCIAIEQYYHK